MGSDELISSLEVLRLRQDGVSGLQEDVCVTGSEQDECKE